MNNFLAPIKINITNNEARALSGLLLRVCYVNVAELKGESYNGYIVMAEWYWTRGEIRLEAVCAAYKKKPKSLTIPISVARYMMEEIGYQEFNSHLKLIHGYLHKALCDRGFWAD